MDISSVAAGLQSALSVLVLDKAMGTDAQSMQVLLEDMKAAVPSPALSPKMGQMDIRA